MNKLVVTVALLTAFVATPALADFWIAREGGPTGKCMVVDKKPTDTKIVIVGGDKAKVYKTKADAEKNLTVVCKAN
jgi:hypothetical protein